MVRITTQERAPQDLFTAGNIVICRNANQEPIVVMVSSETAEGNAFFSGMKISCGYIAEPPNEGLGQHRRNWPKNLFHQWYGTIQIKSD